MNEAFRSWGKPIGGAALLTILISIWAGVPSWFEALTAKDSSNPNLSYANGGKSGDNPVVTVLNDSDNAAVVTTVNFLVSDPESLARIAERIPNKEPVYGTGIEREKIIFHGGTWQHDGTYVFCIAIQDLQVPRHEPNEIEVEILFDVLKGLKLTGTLQIHYHGQNEPFEHEMKVEVKPHHPGVFDPRN